MGTTLYQTVITKKTKQKNALSKIGYLKSITNYETCLNAIHRSHREVVKIHSIKQ